MASANSRMVELAYPFLRNKTAASWVMVSLLVLFFEVLILDIPPFAQN
jgi:hypothetical protein